MESSRFSLAVVLTALYFLSFSTITIHAQNLTAVKSGAVLPTGRSHFALLYDGDDSIYLFGGWAGGTTYLGDVLKYSISMDTIDIVGQLPHLSYGGSAVMNKFRNIFYLPGYGGKDVYQYFPDLRSFANVSSFAEENRYVMTIVADPDTALLFGGIFAPTGILSLNLNTLESEPIGRLQENVTSLAAIWMEEANVAYVFARNNMTQKYSRWRNTTETLSIELPVQQYMSTYGAVSDGKYGYLFGKPRTGYPAQALPQFDPETETFAFIPVEGYVPVDNAAAVYIEKLNRIYTFGGSDGSVVQQDGIWYIDLDPLSQPPSTTEPPVSTTTEETPISTVNPDIFDCLGRPDSNYPYPGDCTRFVICREGHGYAFTCEEPLHFDPVNRHCTFPDRAACV